MWFVFFIACSNPDADAWLSTQLFADNRRWLSRSPDLVAEKLRAMGNDSYDFMRGSLSVTLADIRRYKGPENTAFINDIDASITLLVGDPHPENMATCTDKNGVTKANFIDLDAVNYGPWIMDLRRAAGGYQAWISSIDCNCDSESIEAMTKGYIAGLNNNTGQSYQSTMVANLIEEAIEEGGERKRFYKYTQAGTNHRLTDKTEPLTGNDQSLFNALMSEYRHLTGSFRVLDGGRLYGKGVSSLPAIRFLALVDQGEAGDQDDRLFQLREVIDPPSYLREHEGLGAFQNNANRIDIATQTLWEHGSGLREHRGLSVNAQSFKIFEYSSFCQDPDHDDLPVDWNMQRTDGEEVIAFAADLGFILGQTHSRAMTANGKSQGEVILKDIESGGGETVLANEVLNQSRLDHQKVQQWYGILDEALETRGPLMGWHNLGDSTW